MSESLEPANSRESPLAIGNKACVEMEATTIGTLFGIEPLLSSTMIA
jgi:hypothetical protein